LTRASLDAARIEEINSHFALGSVVFPATSPATMHFPFSFGHR
jgi:hypothetical protein